MTDIQALKEQAKFDSAAAMNMAERLLRGIEVEPNQRAAYQMVQQAARLGHPDGRRAWVYMTNAGLGRKADPKAARKMLAELAKEDKFAALQLAFLDHITCDKRLAEVTPRIICQDPYIALYPGLFSPAECKYIAVLAMPWLDKATVLDLAGARRLDQEVRNNESCSVPHLAEDMVVHAINQCIAAATGTPWINGEPLNILKYQPGQQYKPHHDGTGADNITVREQTALIWLNEQFEGGETDFPKIKVRIRGSVGDMLVFRNVTANGEIDPRMIHAGLPVTEGIKWMASRWIQTGPYLK